MSIASVLDTRRMLFMASGSLSRGDLPVREGWFWHNLSQRLD